MQLHQKECKRMEKKERASVNNVEKKRIIIKKIQVKKATTSPLPTATTTIKATKQQCRERVSQSNSEKKNMQSVKNSYVKCNIIKPLANKTENEHAKKIKHARNERVKTREENREANIKISMITFDARVDVAYIWLAILLKKRR